MKNWIIPLTLGLTIILTTLKCIGVVNIEWWQCSIPVFVGIGLVAILFAIAFVSVFTYALWVRWNESRNHRR